MQYVRQLVRLIVLFGILQFFACKKNPLDIDVSDINVNLKLVRFDLEFCQIDPNNIYAYLDRWQQYGYFWTVYSQHILGLGSPEYATFQQQTNAFFDYCRTYQIFDDVIKTFPPDDKFIYTTLTDAFKHYKYYFPHNSIPTIYTVVSGFNVSVFTGDDFIGISLDKYLGADYPLYKNLGFERYKRRRMIRQMIPVDVMRAWAVAQFPFNDSVNNLLANMIYEGRLQYFLDAMLPDYPDTLKWNYSQMQWKWVNTFEKKIWTYLVERKLLFSQRTLDIKTFTGEAAFTTPFHRNSAPRAGTFIGYKIVKSYMQHNPQVSLAQLMSITDYIQIYNQSYYEP